MAVRKAVNPAVLRKSAMRVLDWKKIISSLREKKGHTILRQLAGKLNVTGVRAAPAKNLSRQIMLATGRPTTAKRRPVTAKELSLGFASSFPVVMAWPSDAPGGPPAFPREAIPALRLHFQSSRAEYVERRLNAHNEGVIELYCKLCLRLIVASRDEFVFPIAVKAHKCGEAWTQGARRVDGENALKTSRPA